LNLKFKIGLSVVYASILSVIALCIGLGEIISFIGLPIFPSPADMIGGFSLIVGASLILYGARDTIKLLYSGLSFYIVGIAIMLGIGLLHITILLADILDYYILCIGEVCQAYPLQIRPEISLFFLYLFSIYPFLSRFKFRREEE